MTAITLWKYTEVGHNQDARKEVKEFNSESVFPTPKPERLMERIITLATSPNDLVLDSFLGSGTTAAVAHKMRRRWISIEMGEHTYTHCKVRLDKVISGEDQGAFQKPSTGRAAEATPSTN
ncbi:DNA methyltransferase [Treponema sp. OMZ 799]|uniref:DNA methyltransferase n=1 Tax=Treponema sp. OMZ 799 TaxID=2563668 RepID=UPI0021110320|nr:site-specific DNA-methyltransferase [Treponema sp. OMZ 799]